jgi:phosphate transport system substrate-binding protein
MATLMKAWSEAFQKLQPQVKVVPTFAALIPEDRAALGNDTAEVFNLTTAPYIAKYGREPFRVQVSMGTFDTTRHIQALGVYVHPENPLRRLTLQQLDAIYSAERRRGATADIITWSQLGLTGEWAEQPIHFYGRKKDNEVPYHFRDVVQLGGPFRSGYAEPGAGLSADVIAAVAGDRFGIGFCGFAYQSASIKRLALAGTDDVVVEPTPAAVASGRYPLSRPLWLYINRVPGRPLDPLSKSFLDFVLSKEGQALVAAENYFPLPPAIAAAERRKLE